MESEWRVESGEWRGALPGFLAIPVPARCKLKMTRRTNFNSLRRAPPPRRAEQAALLGCMLDGRWNKQKQETIERQWRSTSTTQHFLFSLYSIVLAYIRVTSTQEQSSLFCLLTTVTKCIICLPNSNVKRKERRRKNRANDLYSYYVNIVDCYNTKYDVEE